MELSSGGSINADAMELYEISRWGGDFLVMGLDLTGDGKNEVVLLINSGGTGGDGQYLLYVYTVEGKEWKSLDTPAFGFHATVEWDCENLMVSRRFDTDFKPMEDSYSAIVSDAETVQKYYAVMADREPWLELRDTPYTSDFAADIFCDIAVTLWRGEPVLAVAQYIAGSGGIHADRLGYFVSLIKWNDKGGYEVVDEFFASRRFALLSGDAKDADLINPNEVKTEVWQEIYTAGGWLPVTVDAVIYVPLYVNYPVYKMEYYNFTTRNLGRIAEAVIGGISDIKLIGAYSEEYLEEGYISQEYFENNHPMESKISPIANYNCKDKNGNDWEISTGLDRTTMSAYAVKNDYIMQMEEWVIAGDAYPGEPKGTTLDNVKIT